MNTYWDITQNSQTYLRDKNLSLAAKGLLTTMLHAWYPSKWPDYVKENRAETNALLMELESRGYIRRLIPVSLPEALIRDL